jgi:multiple sugar transport system substrate-binding protein
MSVFCKSKLYKGYKMKKILLMAFSIVVTLSFLASFTLIGCKDDGAVIEKQEEVAVVEEATEEVTEEASEEEAEEVSEVVSDEEITLRLALVGPRPTSDIDEANMMNLLTIAQKKYPNLQIQIEYFSWGEYIEKYTTQAATGELPDVMMVSGRFNHVASEGGWTIDLKPYLEVGASDITIDNFPPSVLSAATTLDGQIGFLPKSADTFIIHYNKTMFDEAGIDYPEADWTWEEEFRDIANKLSKDTDEGHVYGAAFFTYYWGLIIASGAYGFEAGICDESTNYEYNFNTPESVEGITVFLDMIKEGSLMPFEEMNEVGGPATSFGLGKTAMVLVNRPNMPTIKSSDIDFGVQLTPSGPGGENFSFSGTNGFAVTSQSEHADAAVAYVLSYYTEEGMKPFVDTYEVVPPTSTLWDSEMWTSLEPPYNDDVFIKQLETSITIPFVPWFNVAWVNTALGDVVYKVVEEGADVQTAVDEAVAIVNAQIAEKLIELGIEK